MKTLMRSASLVISSMVIPADGHCYGQGFVNLNFEAANISGYSANSSDVPISSALPGWSGYFASGTVTNQATLVWYDSISLGGGFISVNDTNTGFGFNPIQGKYSAFLFGGAGPGALLYSAAISQTGLVPSGTESLRLEAQSFGSPFIVTLGGQIITMSPLQTFSTYTLYGGNIPSTLANEQEMLSIIEPAPTGAPPSALEVDAIVFSPSSVVPEPSALGLTALGGLFLAWRCRKALAI